MRLSLLAALALVASAPAAAQAPADTVSLAPGDPSLVTDWMASGTETLDLRLVQPMRQNLGTATLTYAVADGRVTRVQSMTMTTPGGTMTQSDSLVATTALVPLTHNSDSPQGAASLEFMDEGVVGLVTPAQGEAVTVTLLTDAPVFDGGWASEIARSLPFADGYVAKVPAFFAQAPDDAGDMVFSVTGSEQTDAGATAWTVEAAMGPVTFTYLVDAETRALLSTTMAPQPGVLLEFVPAQ